MSIARPRKKLPLIRQSELSECGLACLTMIAVHHGHDIDLASVRRRFAISQNGTTLTRLIEIAGALGFDARPLRVEIDYLSQLRAPCVLHWDLTHFVVLKRVGRDFVELHDPASGLRRLSMEEFGRGFTGIALELTPADTFEPIRDRRRLPLASLTGRIVGLRGAVVQVLILALALELLTLALPLGVQWVLDSVLVSADTGLLTLLALGFGAVVLFQSATTAIRGVLVANVGTSIGAQWTVNLFAHLLRLPMPYFEKRSVGDVMSRFISVQTLQQTLTGSAIEALLDGLTVGLVLLVLFIYSPLLTMAVLAASMLYMASRWACYHHLFRLGEERMTYAARQQSLMLEATQAMLTIKLGNLQAERRARVANATFEVAAREAAIQRVTALFGALSKLLFGLLRVGLLTAGAWMTLNGQFTAGMMVVFITYADMFTQRAGQLIDRWNELRMLRLHLDRIADIALEEPESELHTGYSGPRPTPTIEVEGLGFRYSDDEPWVLRNCSFTIKSGESVALVGPSGCGKTTLAKLLLGLLEPNEGSIRIGGVDIRHLGLAAHRAMFGTVMQDDTLFAGTIADNISSFDTTPEQSRVESAAGFASIDQDIVNMTMGYESLVGDMGSSLSGGQRQRVLLARALYRQPPILLLDEATSHLDIKREQDICSSIAALEVTRIVIAHRPETIASAGRRLGLIDGRVVDLPFDCTAGTAERPSQAITPNEAAPNQATPNQAWIA